MTESQFIKLKIDKDFERLVSPLSEEELCLLEQDLIRDGCQDPLSVWNSTILDDHNRYELCSRLKISFSVQRINLKNREEAIVWICVNQLTRQDIAEEMRKYLIGKRYETEKLLGAHNIASVSQYAKKELGTKRLPDDPFGLTASRTRERLAKEYNVSQATILNYGYFSRALDSLLAVVPELPPKILSGEVRISQNNIEYLSKLTGSEVIYLKQLVSENAYLLGNNAEIRRMFPPKPVKPPPLSMPPGSIKDMPSYDPDAEISSLTLTIPSWVSSINRVRAAANLRNTTKQAQRKLEEELTSLKETIDSMLVAIKEVP